MEKELSTKFHRVLMYTVANDKTVHRYNSPANEDYANCGLHVKLWNLWLMPLFFSHKS